MINCPLKPKFAKCGKLVFLTKTIHPGSAFGNTQILLMNSSGRIISQGFEAGMVTVKFANEEVIFNSLSAEIYLECDPYC